ncbi:MoxR family ATPase [Geotalea daltonii FRC-32]|uniref:MoxR family ATPase n=1 Tax=Geotalea daltonii (strain DSM 22248 / JCM 15807 / FRC-32) TaxID=316067 RepID=B9M2B3_GEODF|nr:MoxR family ATPase [Geotalea daltonii]ACM21231.1 MoxR family ATPase [Geotalea daltonii FRC-32]
MQSATRDKIVSVVDTLSLRYLKGKAHAVRLCFVALLSGGHVLLEDIPGLGKTTLALVLANSMGLSFGRIQCTSDLLPSDITGLSIFNRELNSFHFINGPVFNNILLVDEINRAMPKTQSALLEAMEERRVTVEGVTYQLPEPFLVIATQNPVEQVGTYPLPESQLDRFIIRTGIGYPPEDMEKSIIRYGSLRDEIRTIQAMLTQEDIIAAQGEIRGRIHLADNIVGYIFAIIAATRDHPLVLSGISTRGGINLADAARSVAYLEGRDFIIPEDVREIIVAVGSHRLITKEESQSLDKEELLRSIVKKIPVPLS